MAFTAADTVLIDVRITFTNVTDPVTEPRETGWHRIEKDLYLRRGNAQAAWLCVRRKGRDDLTDEDKVITQLAVDDLSPGHSWEQRPLGVWILRSRAGHGDQDSFVTDLGVLFGTDAVDPRPGWTLDRNTLQLDLHAGVPLARLTVKHGESRPNPGVKLAPKGDGGFKIVQISDLHFGTGPGICEDAIDGHGRLCPAFEADPKSVEFMGQCLDLEKPDLVVLTGDQSEFGKTPDTQTAVFKYTAPLIQRCIPWAIVFGNHDDEGPPSLPRAAQMALFQSLPFCVALPGPHNLDGVGNYVLEVEPPTSRHSALIMFFLDSHNQLPVEGEIYDWIKQSQIDWFRKASQGIREKHAGDRESLRLAFIHIPLLEYNDSDLILACGQKREDVMSPRHNSHFYDALAVEGVAALSCGHDHVNDYCGLLPTPADGTSRLGPWLCYGGGSGFGGYGGYGGYHRRVRVFNVDTTAGRVETWKRVEYCEERVDELVLIDNGAVVPPAQTPKL